MGAKGEQNQTHADIGWRELVNKEDRIWKRFLQPVPPAPRRQNLVTFYDGLREEGGWDSAVRDPQVAQALRHLRRRVAQLQAPETAGVPSDLAFRSLNGRNGRERGPRQAEFRTSIIHPLAYAELFQSRPAPQQMAEPTSIWYPGWGAAANQASLDLAYPYDRKSTLRCGEGPALNRPAWGAGNGNVKPPSKR